MEKEIEQQQEAALKKKVYFKGLPDGLQQETLFKIFSQYGPVERAFIMFNHKTNTGRGFGFVEFVSEEVASKLIGKSVYIEGKEIYISRALERAKGVAVSYLEATNSEEEPDS